MDDILDSTQYMDLIGMNYGEQWVKRIGHRNPGKAFVSTESYVYYNSTEYERWDLVERAPWMDVLENDFNAGLFLWVGARYLGEVPESNDWPRLHGGTTALLDMASFQTIDGDFYEALWSEKPVVNIAVYDDITPPKPFKVWGSPERVRHWNRPEGKAVDLVTYTNCEFVELYLNDRKLGTQKLSDFPNRIMNWYGIEFEVGELKAVGIIDGKPVCEYVLRTAGKPARIEVIADAESVEANDVIHFEVQLLDESGRPVRYQEVELIFDVEGGTVLGLDNGVMTAEDIFPERKARKTNEGKCLCVVRAAKGMDKLKVTLEAEGLPSAEHLLPLETQLCRRRKTGAQGPVDLQGAHMEPVA